MESDMIRMELRRINAELKELSRLPRRTVEKTVGEEYPSVFHRVRNQQRREQVCKAWDYKRRHPGVNISRACMATYEYTPGGYHNLESLTTYCYTQKAVFESL